MSRLSHFRRAAHGAIALVPALSTCAAPSPPPIQLDGRFEDWAAVAVIVQDPRDAAPGSPVDFGELRITDDPAWLYLSVELGRVVNSQALPGTVHLLIDADADSTTGGRVYGSSGVDLALDLSRQDTPQPGGFGTGFALREVGASGLGGYESAYPLGVVAAPTSASSRFELRISRRGADRWLAMGSTVRIQLVATHEGSVGDRTAVVRYDFGAALGADPFPPPDARALARPPGALRVAVWNVAWSSFRTPENHARILAALQPDVILLDELYEEVTDVDLDRFFAHPGLEALGRWRFVLAEGGGRQKTAVAVRDRPIRPAGSMARVAYAPGALGSLRVGASESALAFLDAEEVRGVSATGAWVEVGGAEILFVPLDLQSAGYAGSFQDRLRSVQARTLARHILGEAAGRPVVIGGDFNLVGSMEPLRILREGLDADGGELEVAVLPRLGEATEATWRNPRQGLFGPGRLDLVLYSGAAFEPARGFVFATEDLSDELLGDLGLDRELSGLTSDHLVLVTDLDLRP